MKDAFIHIGFHKTGSTYIQSLIKRNSSILGDFYIVNQMDGQSSRALRLACRSLFMQRQRDEEETKKAIDDIVDAWRVVGEAAGPERKILVSDEEMFGMIPRPITRFSFYSDCENIMQAAIAGLAPRNVRFFAYTRKHSDWLWSAFQECVRRHHMTLTWEEYEKKAHFSQTLEEFSTYLHTKFESGQFESIDMKSDRESDFGLGSGLLGWCGVSDEMLHQFRKPARQNESTPRELIGLYYEINRTNMKSAEKAQLKASIEKLWRAKQ